MKTHTFTTTVTPNDFDRWPYGDEPTMNLRGHATMDGWFLLDDVDAYEKMNDRAQDRIANQVAMELDRLSALAEDAADARREERMLAKARKS